MAKRKSKFRASRHANRIRSELERRQAQVQLDVERRQRSNPRFNIDDTWEVYKANGFTDAQIRQILVGAQKRQKRKTRRIDRQNFLQFSAPTKNKGDATALAQMQRDKYGANARVIQSKEGFSVYLAKSRRAYSSSSILSTASLEKRIAAADYPPPTTAATPDSKRSFWHRLTKRRSKTGQQTTLQELEAQELKDFYTYQERLLKEGRSEGDAYVQAKAAANLARTNKEANLGRGRQALELKAEIRSAKEIEDIKNYEAAKENYNEGVPLSTVARYNSLEIATTATGVGLGAGLAATSIATAGIVPIAALAGFFSAKAIRSNVLGIDLKKGVNNSLDALEVGTSGLVESVRESKDQGQGNWKTGWLLREPAKTKPVKPQTLKIIEKENKRAAKIERRRANRIKRKELAAARTTKEESD